MLLSAIAIVVISWFRVYVAGTLKVDGHGLSGVPVYVVFISFIVALCVYSVSLYKLWRENVLNPSQIKHAAYILAAIFCLMLPMLSNDIFSMLTYGDTANKGVDVYTNTQAFIISPYYDYVSDLWKKAPCVYGPVCLTTLRIATLMGNGSLLTSLVVYKLFILCWALLFIEVMCRLAKLLGTPNNSLLFVVLNPLVLMQGLAQLHTDGIAITLSGCMLYFFLSKKWYWAFVFAALSIATKISFVLMLPFLVVGLFIEKASWAIFLTRTFAGLCITVIILSAVYAPYYSSPETFKVPFNFVFKQDPAKSIAEVVGDIVYFAPAVLSGGENKELHNNLHVKPSTSAKQLEAWLLVKKISQVFALLISVFVFMRFLMGKSTMQQWIRTFLRLILLFLLFYSHVFYAWYLLMAIPFVWYEKDTKFMQWLFVLTCFSNVHDVLCAVNHGTPVYFVVLPLTFLSIVSFIWRFRRVFFLWVA